MIYGYARVSSREQCEDRQLLELFQYGIDKKNIYTDKQSGKDFNRPAYIRLYRKLRAGDLLVVKSIDRLGRNYEEILTEWKQITKVKGADIKILDMPLLDTTLSKDLLGTFIADLVLQLLSFVSENERNNIRQRQKEGIAAAKQRGVRFGRPPAPTPDNFTENYYRWRMGELSAGQAAENCGFEVWTFYRRAREHRSSNF